MKDSGIEWIGEVPASWDTVKIKYVAKFINGFAFESEGFNNVDLGIKVIRIGDFSPVGINFKSALCYENMDEKLCQYEVMSQDVLVAMSGATVGKLAFIESKPNFKSLINQRVGIIRSQFAKYIFYWLQAESFSEYSRLNSIGSAQPNLSSTEIMEFSMPLPQKNEIETIVEALDKKLTIIDQIIVDSKQSIEELKAYKQAVITETVTKGLDKNMPMKDSGVEWIREIPIGWKMNYPKLLFFERKEKANSTDTQLTSSQKEGIISQEEYMKITGSRVVVVEKDFSILKHVEPGDFIISMRSFQGGLEYSYISGCISSAYVMIASRSKELTYDEYYKWLFKSTTYIDALQSTSQLIRDGQAMRYSNFIKISIPTPSLNEQVEISNYLERKITEINSIIKCKEKIIDETCNYKSSLIYEYVTGKKEVV